MRFIFVLMIFCMISISLSALNGKLDYINGIEVLSLCGNNQEMGYAHGFLMNERIINLYRDFLFNVMGVSAMEYNYLHSIFWDDFEVPQKYIDEAKSLILGISDAGYSIYITELNRDMDSTDVIIANSIVDASYLYRAKTADLACSSFSSWGNATAADNELQGNIIMGRKLDFSSSYYMRDNALIIAYQPDSLHSFVSFAYPGIISIISGMNDNMMVVEINMGYHVNNTDFSSKFEPFQFTLRDVLEKSDYDNNDTIDFFDVFSKCKDVLNTGSWLVQTIVPYIDSSFTSAAVIECVNQSGDTFRTSINDSNFAPYNLLLLNHEEVGYEPYPDSRYNVVLDSINADSNINKQRMWNILNSISRASTIQSILFTPNDSAFAVSFADSFSNAASKLPVWFLWSDIFPINITTIKRDEYKPKSEYLVYDKLKNRDVLIYDISGRIVDKNSIKNKNGIYFIKDNNKFNKIYILR